MVVVYNDLLLFPRRRVDHPVPRLLLRLRVRFFSVLVDLPAFGVPAVCVSLLSWYYFAHFVVFFVSLRCRFLLTLRLFCSLCGHFARSVFLFSRFVVLFSRFVIVLSRVVTILLARRSFCSRFVILLLAMYAIVFLGFFSALTL